MRVIAVGCEYSGVSTLIEGLDDWGKERGFQHHLDDHFTIPDAFQLSDEEQQAMLNMLPAIKERFQRLPKKLDELLETKFLKKIPPDPYGGEYVLIENGRVFSTSKFVEKK